MAKIAVLTHMNFEGSGYFNLMSPILNELAKMGHEIKVAGLDYHGTEHYFPFSIIPANTLQECAAIINNLYYSWNMDVILVAMDIPIQLMMFSQLAPFKKKYIAITPLENGPLTMSWAAPMFPMDSVFFISELGKQEALKSGLSKAEHLEIGVDTSTWRPATAEEKSTLRKGLGIDEDEFVILTVADNQERKNLWAGMSAVSKLTHKRKDKKFRYILVTRENSEVGWRLRDLALTLDINQELNIFNRGIPIKDLWGLYAVSDVYIQPSKAEGFGMPVLEAMASGVPVIATDTGALHELLDDKQGFLVPAEYSFTDVWGNSRRDLINIEKLADYMEDILKWIEEGNPYVPVSALNYAKKRTWDIPAKQLNKKIEELLNEQK